MENDDAVDEPRSKSVRSKFSTANCHNYFAIKITVAFLMFFDPWLLIIKYVEDCHLSAVIFIVMLPYMLFLFFTLHDGLCFYNQTRHDLYHHETV